MTPANIALMFALNAETTVVASSLMIFIPTMDTFAVPWNVIDAESEWNRVIILDGLAETSLCGRTDPTRQRNRSPRPKRLLAGTAGGRIELTDCLH